MIRDSCFCVYFVTHVCHLGHLLAPALYYDVLLYLRLHLEAAVFRTSSVTFIAITSSSTSSGMIASSVLSGLRPTDTPSIFDLKIVLEVSWLLDHHRGGLLLWIGRRSMHPTI